VVLTSSQGHVGLWLLTRHQSFQHSSQRGRHLTRISRTLIDPRKSVLLRRALRHRRELHSFLVLQDNDTLKLAGERLQALKKFL